MASEPHKRRINLAVWAPILVSVAAFGTSLYTIRQSDSAQKTSQQTEINGWFDSAVNDLAASSLDVRLGGIFELGRIARDSPNNQPTVMSELAAFVREHAGANPNAGTSATKCPAAAHGSSLAQPSEDVQSALSVIGARNALDDDPDPLNLTYICVARIHLSGANLHNVDLADSDLSGASLEHVQIAGADIAGVQFAGADLSNTNLSGINFQTGDPMANPYEPEGAQQGAVYLAGANLSNSNLSGAVLATVDLSGANLRGANLNGANLAGARLDKASLIGADLHLTNLANASLLATHLEGDDLRTTTITAPESLNHAYITNAVLPSLISPPSVIATPSVPASGTFTEQEGHHGVNTFTNPHDATGQGLMISPAQYIQVSCKIYDPEIASVNPDGYWYRIASSPWDNEYFAPANTFMNGDPWNGPYTHNTDFNVPNC